MIEIKIGDSRKILKELPKKSINCCVTSPPYFNLRDYNTEQQIGQEKTVEEYINNLVSVFRDVRQLLTDDGSLWLNLGDTYKDKQLLGVPWRVALALQDDGWYLRQDIIWHKPNPMPEGVKDRCTKAHEYIFLLSKTPKYYFNQELISEEATYKGVMRGGSTQRYEQNSFGGDNKIYNRRNKRSVWSVNPTIFKEAHFAVFPSELIEPCIQAGCPESGVVIDPFAGSGTTGLVADRLGKNAILIELNPNYISIAANRIKDDCPLFTNVKVG